MNTIKKEEHNHLEAAAAAKYEAAGGGELTRKQYRELAQQMETEHGISPERARRYVGKAVRRWRYKNRSR